jgi:hypothetical protein
MVGRQTVCWTIGCLCDLKPEYAPYNKWNHGFSIVDADSGGAYGAVYNLRIVDGGIV